MMYTVNQTIKAKDIIRIPVPLQADQGVASAVAEIIGTIQLSPQKHNYCVHLNELLSVRETVQAVASGG